MAKYEITSPDGQRFEITAPDNATEMEVMAYARTEWRKSQQPQEPVADATESPGFVRRTGDVATGVLTGVPKAVGALVGLGSLIPGVHYIADPISQGLYDLGEYGDRKLLSDYQQGMNQTLSTAIQEANAKLPPLPEDASLTDRAKLIYDTIVADGGEAASFIAENPSQTINLIGATLPHIVLGGAAGRAVKGGAALVGAERVAGMGAATAGAVGEGLITAGDVTANIVRQNYQGLGTDYSADRLYGVPAGLATGLIARGGARLSPVDIDTIAARGLRGEATDLLQGATAGSVFKAGVRGAVTEGGEEFLQSGQEQMFTNVGQGKPWYEQVGSSAVIGAATGAPLGGGLNAVGTYRANQETNSGTDLDATIASENAQLDAQQQQAEQAAQAQQAQDQARARQDAANDFMSFDAWKKNAIKVRDAQVLDSGTQLGQDFTTWLADNKKYPGSDEKLRAKYAKEFIKDTATGQEEDTFLQEYEKQLDEHLAFREEEGGRSERATAQASQLKDQLLTERAAALAANDKEAEAKVEAQANEFLPAGEWRYMKMTQDGVIKPPSAGLSGNGAQAKTTVAPTVSAPAATATAEQTGQQAATATTDTAVQTPAQATTEAPAATPEAPLQKAPKRENPRIQEMRAYAEERLGKDWEVMGGLSQEFTERKGFYTKRKGKWAFQDSVDQEAARLNAEKNPPAPTVQETAKANEAQTTELRQSAIKYANEKVGNDWLNQRPELGTLLAEGKFAEFQKAIDEMPAPAQPAAETTTPATPPVDQPMGEQVTNKMEGLRQTLKEGGNEQKVLGGVISALKDFKLDDIVTPKGTLSPTLMAKLSGIESKTPGRERQAAAQAWTRLKPKLAAAYGYENDPEGFRKAIAAELGSKATFEEATAADAPVSALDEAELGIDGGMGTIASVGQGNYVMSNDKGDAIQMADEDIAYTQNRSNEEDTFAAKRAAEAAKVRAEFDKNLQRQPGYDDARSTWNNGYESDIENEADRINFDDLDVGSRYEWFEKVLEWQSGDLLMEDLDVYYDNIRKEFMEEQANAPAQETQQSPAAESQAAPQEPARVEEPVREEGTGTQAEQGQQEQVTQPPAKQVKVEVKKKRTFRKPQEAKAPEAPKAREADETQTLSADQVASAVGGSVVWQRGDYALVRGYSRLTGQPVYVASNGTTYTNTDVSVYKGDETLFPADVRAEMVAAKEAAEAADAQKHAETPFVTFNEGLAFSNRVSDDLRGVITEWKDMLGIEADVYFTTLEDAKADKLNLTGPQRAVGSATLDANERGSTRKLPDGSHYIVFDEQASKAATLEVIAHEMGHVHQKEAYNNASPELQKQLADEHLKWISAQTKGSARDLVDALRARKAAKTTPASATMEFNQIPGYWKSFNEWYADQVSRWATTQAKPLSAVEKFFSRLGKAMKSFYEQLTNKKYLPNETFVQYLDTVREGMNKNPETMSNDLQSDAMASKLEEEPGAVEDWVKKSTVGDVASQAVTDFIQAAKTGVDGLAFLHNLIRDVKGVMPSAEAWYDAMNRMEETYNNFLLRVEPIGVAAKKLKQDRLNLVNDFLGNSTFYQKWGYDPSVTNPDVFAGKKVKIDPIMEAKYNRLTEEEQKLVRDIFAHGEATRKELAQIAKELDVPKEFVSVSGLDGPYAPLKRFGGFATELKSSALLAAEKALKETPNNQNRRKVDELKSDPANYEIRYFDTMGQADRYAKQNAKKFPDYHVPMEKQPGVDEGRMMSADMLERVMAAIGASKSSGLDKDAKEYVRQTITKLYIDSLDDRNARLSGVKRKNRAGYEPNMIRAFLFHAHGQGRLLAQMKHGGEVSASLVNAANEARDSGTNRTKTQKIYNTIVRHYQSFVRPDNHAWSPLVNRIASVNTVYSLVSNMRYFVVNLIQPNISVAKMAADFGSLTGSVAYAQSLGKLTSAYKVAWKVIDGNPIRHAAAVATIGLIDTGNTVGININRAPAYLQPLLKKMQGRQLLDVGMEQDLNYEETFDTGYGVLNTAKDGLRNVSQRLYQVSRITEAYNRVASAVAAYEMAKANPAKLAKMNMTPEEYAIAVVEDTQGNFSKLDAPLLIKEAPKLTVQYRKYQIMMGWLWGKAFKNSFNYKSANAYERAVARRMVGALATNTFLLSGLTGLPFVPWIFTMAAGDDGDEPQDLERYIRTEMYPDDDKMADFLSRGLTAYWGFDMSQALKQSDIFSLFPYSEFDPTEEGAKNYVFEAIAGPTSGLVGNFGRGFGYLEKGQYAKAFENFLPKGVRSYIETYRFANEGVTMTNGNMMLDPREIDVGSLMLNAMGIPPQEIAQLKWTRGQQYELEQWFSNESGRIRREYIEASDNRDRDAMNALRQEWRDLQDQKDRVRPFFNGSRNVIRRQPVVNLIRAPRERARDERRMQDQLGTR